MDRFDSEYFPRKFASICGPILSRWVRYAVEPQILRVNTCDSAQALRKAAIEILPSDSMAERRPSRNSIMSSRVLSFMPRIVLELRDREKDHRT
jgi:hypothetical protein